ncbi:LysM peptidoglycan-binding domain-containing protein [Aquamicrobium sp. LC103]|uniref:LysM peptidoglycan-binding domain-containing protein n=1 Tax=Aquamicrobium sp. LC103 TaxID=1120658 RepID=UPI000AF16393|nr:LysM peptidoglycan-binding domain-containing protein [Aquamicrobium sp. LC103]TKT81309.1 LysM peptidoglycan-binding domain-containing protein [Aquamicrobium sp. LC103]
MRKRPIRTILTRLAAGAALCLPALAYVSPAAAQDDCGGKVGVRYGDTVSSIAQACGVNVQTVLQANPGLTADNLKSGTYIIVPPPALPSPMNGIGRPLVRQAPSLVPPVSIGAPSSVILPPPQPPIPQQHILRGFGDEPGQLPLPPGHYIKVP